MLGFKEVVLLFILSVLTACTATKQQPTTELGQLKNLHMQFSRNLLKNKTDNFIRFTGLKETAQGLGARAALAWRAKQINNTLKIEQKKLDHIYNFTALLLPHNVLPPVLLEGDHSLELRSDDVLRISDKTYRIAEQAHFVTAAPTWRSYLWMNYDVPQLPHNTMLPRNAEEQAIWKEGITEGWHRGLRQADAIFRSNLNTISQKFKGMATYRKLLAQNMVSAPYVSKVDLGVTGDGQRMDVNDKVLRITALPRLNDYSQSWQPGLSTKKS